MLAGLVKQLQAIQFFVCQGLTHWGHDESDGKLYQLLWTWAKDSTVTVEWLKHGKFMTCDRINELITLMGHNVLRMLLASVKFIDPSWYEIIAEEATDVS